MNGDGVACRGVGDCHVNTSPGGIELVLTGGDACLFPASVSGDFKVEVHESPQHMGYKIVSRHG